MKQYKVAILGATGAVGREMMKVLAERDFPISELHLLASQRSVGQAASYDLCIDASILGLEETVAYILRFIERRKALRQQRKEAERPPHFG